MNMMLQLLAESESFAEQLFAVMEGQARGLLAFSAVGLALILIVFVGKKTEFYKHTPFYDESIYEDDETIRKELASQSAKAYFNEVKQMAKDESNDVIGDDFNWKKTPFKDPNNPTRSELRQMRKQRRKTGRKAKKNRR